MSYSLDPDAQALLDEVRKRFTEADERHLQFRRKAERWWRMYNSVRDFRDSVRDARARRDVDDILRDGQRTFGTHLFIPYAFSVVETTLPRMIASNPKLTVLPRRPEWEDSTENVKMMLDAQQDRIEYPLTLQSIGKSGLIYGLGVEKVLWDKQMRKGKSVLQPSKRVPVIGSNKWAVGKVDEVIYEGPNAECVDVFDWLWDPYAFSARTLRYAFHRTWRDNAYVKAKIESGDWELPPGVSLEDVLGMGDENGRDELWADRMATAGYTSPNQRGDHMHEVWEFHDGERVVHILDRQIPVQAGPNPFWHGELPFHVYRPTEKLHHMEGIGEIESIQDLIEEMNEMRSQRRDNAQLVLQRPFAYFDGLLDPGDIAFGPGIGIPVDGDPREVIFPLPLQDIPASSYQEEARLQADIERVTGIDDTVSGTEGTGAAQTATGVQLVQQAANVRIALKTTRVELEICKRTAAQFLALDQQHIIEEQPVIGPPKPGEGDREWSWYMIGPAQLAGQFAIDVEGGSTQPKNPVADQQQAQSMMLMFGQDPLIDPEKPRTYALKKGFGVDAAQSWLRPREPEVPLHVLEMAVEALAGELGADPDQFRAQFDELVQGAMAKDAEAQQAQQQGGAGPAQAPAPAAPPPVPA